MKQIIELSLVLLLGATVGCGGAGGAGGANPPGSGSGIPGSIDGTWRLTGVKTTYSGNLSLAQVSPLIGEYLESEFNVDRNAAAGIRASGGDLRPVLTIQNGSGSLALTNTVGCTFRLAERFQYSNAVNGVGQIALLSPAGPVAVSGTCSGQGSAGISQVQNLSTYFSYQIQGNQLILSNLNADGQRAWIYSR